MYSTDTVTKELQPSRLIDRSLYWAAHKGDLGGVNSLLDQGARLYSKGESGPVEAAINAGHVDILRLLFERGAEIERLSISGNTPLGTAVINNMVGAAAFLIEMGADIRSRTDAGSTLMHLAARTTLPDMNPMITLLLRHGVDVNVTDTAFGNAPLHDALYHGHCEAIIALIEAGARVEAQNIQGRTPIFEGVKSGCIEAMRELLKHGVNLNHQDRDGWTPLHLAAGFDQEESAIFLLANGADHTVRDHESISVQEASYMRGQTDGDEKPRFVATMDAFLDARRASQSIESALGSMKP